MLQEEAAEEGVVAGVDVGASQPSLGLLAMEPHPQILWSTQGTATMKP